MASPFVVHALGGGPLILLLCALPAFWLVGWGAPIVSDGVTDLYARWTWREISSGRSMELDEHGVRYAAAVGLRPRQPDPVPDLDFSWSSVVAAEFRPGPADSWWFCLDVAPSAWSSEQTMATWETGLDLPSGSAPEEATARRRLAENLLLFGTPLAVNLEICPGIRPRRLDQALQRWTDGRLRARPPEPPWWRPPQPSPLLWAWRELREIFTGPAARETMASGAAPPPTSCLVGAWLVGITQPAQMIIAEVLGLAEDGYVEVVADHDGYTVRRGPADPAVLWPDRAEVLAGLFRDGEPARLARPAAPPQQPPNGPISADRVSTALSRAIEMYGFATRLRWLVLAGVILGLGVALAALALGRWEAVLLLGLGVGLLATGWLQSPVRPSRAARAERDRLHQLRIVLRDGPDTDGPHTDGADTGRPDTTDPALLPWAFLLLTDDELAGWWRRARPISDQPRWLTWRATRSGGWPGLMTDHGLIGLVRALAHHTGP